MRHSGNQPECLHASVVFGVAGCIGVHCGRGATPNVGGAIVGPHARSVVCHVRRNGGDGFRLACPHWAPLLPCQSPSDGRSRRRRVPGWYSGAADHFCASQVARQNGCFEQWNPRDGSAVPGELFQAGYPGTSWGYSAPGSSFTLRLPMALPGATSGRSPMWDQMRLMLGPGSPHFPSGSQDRHGRQCVSQNRIRKADDRYGAVRQTSPHGGGQGGSRGL